MDRKFVFKSNQCTGCKSCELACSFHHKKVFDPNIASIEINKSMGGFEIAIYKNSMDMHFACDLCGSENNERQCVKFCSPLFKKELESFIYKMTANGNKEKK